MSLVIVSGGLAIGGALLRSDRVISRQKTAACLGVSGHSWIVL